MQKYNHKKIESKWQKYWAANKTFVAKDFSKKPSARGGSASGGKKYVLCEFPYPSGVGLHMGHLRPYVAGDVYSRFNRMKGFETVFPMGWDAFGLPAENYAIKMGVHPSKTTAQNVKNAKRQLQSWGMSFDWSREVNTTDPAYYKWTQWLFLQFYKAGLAYEATGLINWCPKDKTGLANEEVIDGKCERCGTVVEKKELRQWYLKITAYAEKLLEGLKHLPEWPDMVKLQQENWIGKSVGAEIEFPVVIPATEPESKPGSGSRIPSSAKAMEDRSSDSSGMVQKPNFVLLHGYNGSPKANFFPWLKSQLESRGYSVEVPVLPAAKKPVVADQVRYVLDNCHLNEDTILIGHSLGGVVAMKVMEKLDKPVRKLILAASFFENRFKDHDRFDSLTHDWKFDFEKIKKRAGKVLILRDSGDPVIFEDQADKLAGLLGGSVLDFAAEHGHITGKQEPFLLDVLFPKIKVFTTRPDTIYGATYMVLAPEHPLITNYKLQITNFKEVEKYIEKAKSKQERERAAAAEKDKTGVEMKGVKAINPATGEEIPVWIADYVLWGYGTGAIMAVPAHDERDFEFAKKFGLPVRCVVTPTPPSSLTRHLPLAGEEAPQQPGNHAEPLPLQRGSTPTDSRGEGVGVFIDSGILVNSGEFTGMSSEEALPKMAAKFGKLTTQYKLRDWVFSRQRYWGEPIPIIHCPECGIVPVPEKDLPVKLPNVQKYEPTGTGESPLAGIKKWVNVKCPKCKSSAKRETNTMPQWAGSSWYWLRYTDPKNKKSFADKKKQNYWTPVDVYFGGMEHTTLHLLYSRFWNNFLYDKKLVSAREPYLKRVPHGIILGPDGEKMSKSRGNVVNPDSIVENFGADTLRMYELFIGPHEATVPWNEQGHIGVRRFLDRVWEWCVGSRHGVTVNSGGRAVARPYSSSMQKDSEKTERLLHKLIKKVTEDIEQFHYNTCVSAFMEFYNQIKDEQVSLGAFKIFLTLLYPFAPHLSEELHEIMGGKKSLQLEAWPKWDPKKIVESTVEIIVQVNGKVKGKITVAANATEEKVKAEAVKLEAVAKILAADSIKRMIVVPNRLVNLVV